jgi:probable F420-dependent oxidoreductase
VKLGLYGINMGACLDPAAAIAVARAAEAAGYDSVWTAEHVVLPDPKTPESPIPAQTPLLDPAVALAHVAGHTRTLRLATGIIILPQRNPVVLAKELASLDVLSRGRLIFGVGAGYIPAEFAAIGAVFEERGERTNESIEVVRALWTMEKPRFAGRFHTFADVDAHPRPLQKPHPPIVVGGMSPPAYRRALRQGNGWYGFGLDVDATARSLEGLREARKRVERPADLGELEISVTPAGRVDRDTFARFEALGVDRLVIFAPGGTAAEAVASVDRAAEELGPLA